jgi:AcrR family transcriptional regulator
MATDARVKYTKMIIEKSFVELLKVKQLNKITVKELCDLSEINRSTFYKYYDDIFDLFDKMIAKSKVEFHNLIQEMKGQGRRKALTESLEKIKKNGDVYITLITEQRGHGVLDEALNEFFYELIKVSEVTFLNIPKDKQMWILNYLVWGCSGIVRCWANNEMKESTQKVATLIDNLIDNTLNFASIP